METQTPRSPRPRRDVPNGTTPLPPHTDDPGIPESFDDDPVLDAIIASCPDVFKKHPHGSVIVTEAEDGNSETQATHLPETPPPRRRDMLDGIIPPPPDPVSPGTPESFYDDPVMDAIIASLPDTYDMYPPGNVIVIETEGSSNNSETQAPCSPPDMDTPDDIMSPPPHPDDPGTPDSYYDDPVINDIIASLPDSFEPLPPGGIIVIPPKDSSSNSFSGLEGKSDHQAAIDEVGVLDDESGKGLE